MVDWLLWGGVFAVRLCSMFFPYLQVSGQAFSGFVVNRASCGG